MATNLFARDPHTSAFASDLVPHNFCGKQLFVDFIGGGSSASYKHFCFSWQLQNITNMNEKKK